MLYITSIMLREMEDGVAEDFDSPPIGINSLQYTKVKERYRDIFQLFT